MAIGFIYMGIIGILLYFNGKGYYAAAIYPTLMAFGGIWLAQLVQNKSWAWLRFVLPASIIIITIITLPLILPVMSPEKMEQYYQSIHADKTAVLKWEDHEYHPLPQDFSDLGFRKFIATMPVMFSGCLIIFRNNIFYSSLIIYRMRMMHFLITGVNGPSWIQ